MGEDIGMAFIHGAGLGSWIWKGVEMRLPFPSLRLDFPDRGKGAANPELSLEDYTRHLLDGLEAWSPRRVILVVHSIGGVVGLRVAARLGPRLAGFVAVCAAIPADGGAYLSCLPFSRRLFMTAAMVASGTRPPESAIRKGLCSDLPRSQADEVVRRFVAEARALYAEPCRSQPPKTRTLYVKTAQDREFPPPLQEAMARNLGAAVTARIESGHLPMLSRPDDLAMVLERFAAVPAAVR